MSCKKFVKAVILDWAGTVLDCGVRAPVVAFQSVFQREGVPISVSEARLPMGLGKRDHLSQIIEIPAVSERWKLQHGKYPAGNDIERMYRHLTPALLNTMNLPSQKMIGGVVNTVQYMRHSHGLKIGSTTGFSRKIMDKLASLAGRQGYAPDAIVCSDEVSVGRPFPFMIEANARLLGIEHSYSLVKVGDTDVDIKEGLCAKTWTVGVAKTGNYMGMTEEELVQLQKSDFRQYNQKLEQAYKILLNAGAHYVIDDVTGLPAIIDDINHRLSRGELPK